MFDIFQEIFIRNAFLAGTLLAIVAAIAGYFLVLRGLTFAGHALPNIGFAGAAGAVLLGVNPVFGLLAFTMLAGVAIGLLGKRIHERDIAVGVLMTFALGMGLLFLTLYSGYAESVYSILFGNIVGINPTDVQITMLFSVIALLSFGILFRPLLFSSIDPVVAEARGIPVKFLALLFLLLVAVTVSMSVKIVGALLFFTLLIGPAATAMRLVRRPLWTLLLSMLLGVSYTWLGIFLAANGTWPVSFYIASISFGVYLPVRLLSPLWMDRTNRTISAIHTEAAVTLQNNSQPQPEQSTPRTGHVQKLLH